MDETTETKADIMSIMINELNLKGTSSRLQSIIEIQTEKNKDSI